jgi:hypothetical protein
MSGRTPFLNLLAGLVAVSLGVAGCASSTQTARPEPPRR